MGALRSLPFVWNGEAMVPMPRFRLLAERQFEREKVYVFEPKEAVSHKERGFFMASVKDAWDNLSAEAVARYPSANHLRKWALIKAGWRTETFAVFETHAQASQHAAFLRGLDDTLVIVVSDTIVRVYKARSQRVGDPDDGCMTKEEWRRSKDDVLAILAGHLGVTVRQLESEGRN